MDIENRMHYDEKKLTLEFIELLFKEKLINQETYYNAKQCIHSEFEQE